MPVTREQFDKLIGEGFTVEEIVEFDKRSQQEQSTQQPKQNMQPQNILGQLMNVPGAAIRSAIQGTGYTQGALNPDQIPTFQDLALNTYYDKLPNFPGKTLVGNIPSTVGLAADIVTNPANLLGMLIGKVPMGSSKTLGGVISASKPVQTLKQVMTEERHLSDLGKVIINKFPKVMSDKWIISEASRGQQVVENLNNALSTAYDDIYGLVKNVKVDPNKMDDILLRSNLDDIVLKDIDGFLGQNYGSTNIDTVEKAKMVADIINKRTPQSYYISGGTSGKGGLTNPKIRQINTRKAIKDEITQSIASVDKELSTQLKSLDTFAHDKVYPTLDKMRSIFGRKEIPSTEGITSTYSKVLGKASQRETIRSVPKISEEFKNYVNSKYFNDLEELVSNSKHLVKNMNKFRQRQLMKVLGGLLVGGTIVGKVTSTLAK